MEIGEQFEEIFRETVKINTLDNQLYRRIQQNIIDVLDKGETVQIKGKGQNATDLTVKLHHLENPAKQTNFENCVADVNIPVGEVFTSPVLKGTNGTLAVSRVFLNGLEYKNLKVEFSDGRISGYSCSNFASEEENQNFYKGKICYITMIPCLWGKFAIGNQHYGLCHGTEISDRPSPSHSHCGKRWGRILQWGIPAIVGARIQQSTIRTEKRLLPGITRCLFCEKRI